ncbi:MAG: DNA-directed RNA polymerase subunit omega [Synergistaceae bacterium]
MIYMDLEKIYAERDIPNKYILTLVLAARARQLSERKEVRAGLDEKYISMAVDDITNAKVDFEVVNFTDATETEDEQLEKI